VIKAKNKNSDYYTRRTTEETERRLRQRLDALLALNHIMTKFNLPLDEVLEIADILGLTETDESLRFYARPGWNSKIK